MFSVSPILTVFLSAAHLLTLNAIDLSYRQIEWISVEQNEVLLMHAAPVGAEDGHHLYLCRAVVRGQYYSGKIQLEQDQIFCLFPYGGSQGKSGNFQMLNSPPGTTSWIPHPSSIPSNTIYTHNAGNVRTYVCRASFNGEIIPGTMPLDQRCFIEYHGSEYFVSSPNSIEILVLNKYGQNLGVTQVLARVSGQENKLVSNDIK